MKEVRKMVTGNGNAPIVATEAASSVQKKMLKMILKNMKNINALYQKHTNKNNNNNMKRTNSSSKTTTNLPPKTKISSGRTRNSKKISKKLNTRRLKTQKRSKIFKKRTKMLFLYKSLR